MKPSIDLRLVLANLLEARHQRALLLALLAGLLFAGLYPFHFFPANQVSWLQGQPGIRFGGYGEIFGLWPATPKDQPNTTDAFSGVTVEFWVASPARTELKELLAVDHSGDKEPFAIDDWATHLLIDGIFRGQRSQGFRHIDIDKVFVRGVPRFVTITTSKEGTTIYLEGLVQERYPGLELAPESFSGTLLLGQTSHARQEWYGEIRGLAIYWKALTPSEVAKNYEAWVRGDWRPLRAHVPAAIYPLDEGRGSVVHNRGSLGYDLAIPRKLRALDPVILGVPSRRDLMNVSDVVLNVIGFIPLGLLLVFYLKNKSWTSGKAAVSGVVAGFLVSLVIELLQVFLPSRDSSLLDVFNNTVGSGIGAWIGVLAGPWLRRIQLHHR